MSAAIKPDYLFETSWEVCNKVGGIYTVISTKAPSMVKQLGDNYILIGPDIWKETVNHPEFEEDATLFQSWRNKALSEGFNFRVGRWKIESRPIAILLDFTTYFERKDGIFSRLWEQYKLDSLSGQWDYVEPALFGYAAGQVIESFYNYYLNNTDLIIAQFHEWMTGSGILYLKAKVPQVGTVFTTHATALGRSIAGNGLPLYRNLDTFNPSELATRFNIKSKYSLEKLSAQEADSFTTVSELTGKECTYLLGKSVDMVTPNGFDDKFVPQGELFVQKQKDARNSLLSVARGMLNQNFSDDTLLVCNSGRYEFKNKGIDIFIDALADLNRNPELSKEVIAFITVPAGHMSGRHEILERMENPDYNNPLSDLFLTHHLYHEETDPIIARIKQNNLHNSSTDKVKIIFVPCYLDGRDGIFNLPYYDLLIGFDLTVFPSYYEPWGYTPLESLAFSIPTITTTLAGFGLWVQQKVQNKIGADVIERNDDNDSYMVYQISKILKDYTTISKEQYAQYQQNAYQISRIAVWKNLSKHYFEAYAIALEKAISRSELYMSKIQEQLTHYEKPKPNYPEWKKVFVRSQIPAQLDDLKRIAHNLWWTWNIEAEELFESIDPKLWKSRHKNPIFLLETLSFEKLTALTKDVDFLSRLKKVADKFDAYMSKASEKGPDKVAYFSMEFGLHDNLKIFSGGLGILAGDYLKEASDSNANIIGVGLLYRYGYFRQTISLMGDQLAQYHPQKFSRLPIVPMLDENGMPRFVRLALPGRVLYARIWRANVGRTPLYLLDTDILENSPQDREITHQLYGGDWENRLKQELLLGVGGIRLLSELNIEPTIYHCNEGHAAFIGVERLRKYVNEDKLHFNAAIEVVRSSTLFTTHTPVPAGHDAFSEDVLRKYIPHYAERLGIEWNDFLNLGKVHENNPDEKFSMSVLAVKLSQEVNGVSRIHGKVSQQMFNHLYNGYYPNESHIDYVTNGVHMPFWAAKEWHDLYFSTFPKEFTEEQCDPKHWQAIHQVPDQTIWNIRKTLKKRMLDYIKERLNIEMTQRQENPNTIFAITDAIDEDALIIGFARRFATYKRAHLLFQDLERLRQVISDPKRPVIFLYAGKAHPHDKAGQDLIKKIIEISKTPGFIGHVIFIENYDIDLAKKLVSGVDIWLNTPTRPLEASGTSGEKAVMNGVVNFSVLDGWWAEGYLPEAGWALSEERTYDSQHFQDKLDVELIYNLFEDEIMPMYFDKDEDGISKQWIQKVKHTISDIAPNFTMRRMLKEYQNKFYYKLFDRTKQLKENHYHEAYQLALWKKRISDKWDGIELLSIEPGYLVNQTVDLGQEVEVTIKLGMGGLKSHEIGIELLVVEIDEYQNENIINIQELEVKDQTQHFTVYGCQIHAMQSGVLNYAFRMFPKHKLLPYRQDFNLVKWL